MVVARLYAGRWCFSCWGGVGSNCSFGISKFLDQEKKVSALNLEATTVQRNLFSFYRQTTCGSGMLFTFYFKLNKYMSLYGKFAQPLFSVGHISMVVTASPRRRLGVWVFHPTRLDPSPHLISATRARNRIAVAWACAAMPEGQSSFLCFFFG